MDYRTLTCYSDANKNVNVVVEIPKGTYNKYEIDEKTGDKVVVVRQLHKGKPDCKYPFNYGFIPSTLAPDKDQLDAVLITDRNFAPLTIVACKVIDVLHTVDHGEIDDKIIVVPADEFAPKEKELEKKLSAIRKYMEFYKYPDQASTTVEGYLGREEALKTIERYRVKKTKKQADRTNFVDHNKDPFGTVIGRINF